MRLFLSLAYISISFISTTTAASPNTSELYTTLHSEINTSSSSSSKDTTGLTVVLDCSKITIENFDLNSIVVRDCETQIEVEGIVQEDRIIFRDLRFPYLGINVKNASGVSLSAKGINLDFTENKGTLKSTCIELQHNTIISLIGESVPKAIIEVFTYTNKNGSKVAQPSVELKISDCNDNLLRTTVTNDSGIASIELKDENAFAIEQIKLTYQTNSNNIPCETYTLDDNIRLDMPIHFPSYIEGYVWNDDDLNGTMDSTDDRMEGIELVLTNASGETINSSTSTVSGYYRFDRIPSGTLRIEALIPTSTYRPTYADIGNEELDSELTLLNNKIISKEIDLKEGESMSNFNLGVAYNYAQIGGRVFVDSNNDGKYSNKENGLEGVMIEIYTEEDMLIDAVSSQYAGIYIYDKLIPGKYYLKFKVGENYIFSMPYASEYTELDSDVVDEHGRTATIDLVPGQIAFGLNAGLIPYTSCISGKVWHDKNQNGILENDKYPETIDISDYESTLRGIKIRLIDSQGTVVRDTTSTTSGSYMFCDIEDGLYTIQFMAESGHVFSYYKSIEEEVFNSNVIDRMVGTTEKLAIVSGNSIGYVNAGLFQTNNMITGKVWKEQSDNSYLDKSDLNLKDIEVALIDTAGLIVSSTKTVFSGQYQFADIAQGEYTLRFTLPEKFEFVEPTIQGNDRTTRIIDTSTGYTDIIMLHDSSIVDSLNVGLIPLFANVAGYVWEDINANGIREHNEPGIDGIEVQLLDSDMNPIETTTSGLETQAGQYSFNGIDNGKYTIQFGIEEGESSSPISGHLGLDSKTNDNYRIDGLTLNSKDLNSQNAGIYYPAAIADIIWEDLNIDGVQSENEPGIPGLHLQLVDVSGSIHSESVTDSDGFFEMDDIRPGTYNLLLETQDDYSPSDSDLLSTSSEGLVLNQIEIKSGDVLSDLDIGLIKITAREPSTTMSPNPSSGVMRMDYTLFKNDVRVKYLISDPYGNQILQKDLGAHRAGQYTENIDLSGRPFGLYTIKIVTGFTVHIHRIMLTAS